MNYELLVQLIDLMNDYGKFQTQNSVFDRVISKPRSFKVLLVIYCVFLVLLLITTFLDGDLGSFIQNFHWRGLLISPTIIIYILAVAPSMARMENRVLNSHRAIIDLNDSEFTEHIRTTSTIEPKSEMISIGIGIFLGIFSAMGSMDGGLSWVTLYWIVTSTAMYTLLVWTIYVSVASTRFTSKLLHQPLKTDSFDTTPFEPIGKQSLLLALVFIGGITLSLIFIGLDLSSLKQPGFWLIYAPLAMVPVILFFLNMKPAHRLLADAKAHELKSVRGQLQSKFRKLLEEIEQNQESNNISVEIIALLIYENQLKETQTWPYNTSILRTLFFSVLIPVGTLVGRIIIEALAN